MQKGSASLFVILGFLLVLILSSLLYFVFFKTSVENFFVSSLVKPQKQIEAEITNKKAKESIYSAIELGFQFSYPKNGFTAVVDTEEAYNKRGNGNYRKNFKGYVSYEPPEFLGATVVLDESDTYETNPFSVWVFNNEQNLSKEKWFDLYWYYPFLWGVFDYTSKGHITPDKEATISGEKVIEKTVSYQNGSPKYLYVSKNQKMYLFRIIGETGNKILSTLEFK